MRCDNSFSTRKLRNTTFIALNESKESINSGNWSQGNELSCWGDKNAWDDGGTEAEGLSREKSSISLAAKAESKSLVIVVSRPFADSASIVSSRAPGRTDDGLEFDDNEFLASRWRTGGIPNVRVERDCEWFMIECEIFWGVWCEIVLHTKAC